MAASNGSEFFELDVEFEADNTFPRASNAESVAGDEAELRLAAMERLPSQRRTNTSSVRRTPEEPDSGGERADAIDVRKLNRFNRELVVRRALDTADQDNFKLLSGIKERLDRCMHKVNYVEI